jgi:hypothetical protein
MNFPAKVVILTEKNERMRLAKEIHSWFGPLSASLKMSVSAFTAEGIIVSPEVGLT